MDPAKTFVDHLDEFFKELAKDNNPSVIKFVNKFGDIIMELSGLDLEKAWTDMKFQRMTTFISAEGDNLKVLKGIEVILKRRMYIDAKKADFAMGASRKLKFQVITGDFPYFESNGVIDLDAVINTQEQPQNPVPQPNAPIVGFTQEQIQVITRAIEEKIANQITGLSTSLQRNLQPLSPLEKFALWSIFLMCLGISILLGLTFLKVKHMPEKMNYSKELILKVKGVGEDNEKSLNRINEKINISFEAVQDTLDKRLPKAKAKK